MAQRSTKGASKQRRDAINDKIAQMRELIPVSEAVRPRMSQLQVMALTNAYIAKSNFFEHRYLEADNRSTFWSDLFDISPTLPGFLLIVSVADGRILYVSDSVSEYLGNSAVDILTQLETVYELIDDRDREILRQAIQHEQQVLSASSPAAAATEPWMRDINARDMLYGGDKRARRLSFTCRMNIAARGVRNNTPAQSTMKFGFDRQKIMQVNGQFVRSKSSAYCSYSNDQTSSHVLVAYCTPHLVIYNGSGAISGFASADNIEGNTDAFYSLHQADMKFARIEPNGEYHLGYSREEINGKSWYEMIHPADIETAKCKHMELIKDYQIGDMSSVKSCCVRIQSARGNFLWLHIVLRIHDVEDCATTAPITDLLSMPAMLNMTAAQPPIICTNHVIDEQMAAFLRARENEVQLSTKNDIPPARYSSFTTGSSLDQIEGGMIIPDFELSDFFSTVKTADIASRQNTGSSHKRKFNDIEEGGIVPRKTTKITEEDSFDMISMQQNMVLSMPSPPGPRWEFDNQQMSPGQFLPNYSPMFGNGSMQSFSFQGVMDNRWAAPGPVSNFVPSPSMHIQESYINSQSPPLVTIADSFMADTYMAVPDMQVNNLELENPWEFPTMYGNEPASLSTPSKTSSPSNHGASLPVLDHSVVESVLGSLETDTHPFSSVHSNAANPVAVARCVNETDNTALFHELLYLGQEFLKSEFGSIYNNVDLQNFV